MNLVNDLYDLCETLGKELTETNEKIKSSGGKLTGSDLDFVDKLTHAVKSVKTTIAMIENEDGYSQRGSYDGRYRNNYNGNYMNGMRRNGRYSSRGDMVEELQQLMEDAPNESIRQDISRLINKVQSMQ